MGCGGGPQADRGAGANRKPLVPDRQAAPWPVRCRSCASLCPAAPRWCRRRRRRCRLLDSTLPAWPSSENAVKNRWNSIMNRKWAHDIQQAGHIATAAGTSPVSASAGADGGEPGLVPTPPSAHRRRRAAAGTGPRCHVPGAPGAAAPGTGSSPCVEAVRGTAPDVVTEESQVFFRGLPGRRNRRLRRPEPAHRAATSSGQPSSPHPTSPADAGGSRQSPRDTAATLGQGVVPRQSQRFRYRAPASSVQEAVSSAYQSLASGSAVPPLPTPESGADTGFLANRQVAWRQRGARAGAVAARMSAEEAEEAVGVPQRRRPDAGTLPNTAAEGSDGLRVAQQFLVSEMARQRLFDRVSLQCVCVRRQPPDWAASPLTRVPPPSVRPGAERTRRGRVARRHPTGPS